jgi:hypothetical protein
MSQLSYDSLVEEGPFSIHHFGKSPAMFFKKQPGLAVDHSGKSRVKPWRTLMGMDYVNLVMPAISSQFYRRAKIQTGLAVCAMNRNTLPA